MHGMFFEMEKRDRTMRRTNFCNLQNNHDSPIQLKQPLNRQIPGYYFCQTDLKKAITDGAAYA